MATVGKAYGSRSSHGGLSASTAQARGPGIGDINWTKFVAEPHSKEIYLRLVQLGAYHVENLWKERPLCLDDLA